ncbi:MAG TPA: 5'-3' exonuclease H3TH domain-containing protein [Atribacteraceae bacterium]|nr:5'-3' exonuclease H3TH domain-containing protein [Atribacteraceae bacterium]
MPPEKKNIVLIDGYSLAYRAFYALPRFETRAGHPTGATYGFYTMLWKVIEGLDPYTVLVAFDFPRKTFRHSISEAYKAHRKPTPDELKLQFQDIREIIGLLSFDCLEEPGYEADDIIGSLRDPAARIAPVSILTSDLDMMQLVDDRTVLLRTVRRLSAWQRLDVEAILRDMGVSPRQVVDLISMVGDPSDNIPGIPGIGEKTAVRLLRDYNDWEGILSHLDDLPLRLRKAVEDYRGTVVENRKLATILTNLPLKVDFGQWDRTQVHWDELVEKLVQLEFRKAKDRLFSLRPSRTGSGAGQRGSGNEQKLTCREAYRFFVYPLPENRKALLDELDGADATRFVNAQTALFLTHPCLMRTVERLIAEEKENLPGLMVALAPFLSLSRQWLEDNPALFAIYRRVEVPLLKRFLTETNRNDIRELYLSPSPFTGMTDLSSLPLFRFRPSPALIVFPKRYFAALLDRGPEEESTGEERDGFRMSLTLYGARFVARADSESGKGLSAIREALCRNELERIVGVFLYEAGAKRVFTSENGLFFTCEEDRLEGVFTNSASLLQAFSTAGLFFNLAREEPLRASLQVFTKEEPVDARE